MATAPSPNDLTRQQLDELDALLQRMLSVPLAPADTPMPVALNRADAAPLPPSWRIDPPAAAPAVSVPHLLLADPLDEQPPPLPKPEPAKPQPAPKPHAITKPQPAPEPKPHAPKPEPAKPQPAPVPTPQVAAPAPPVPFPLVPLVALNAAFDGACGLFGPPGKLLRSGFFKHVYGLTGLGLLAYTAAHVAQVQGWISLPVTLPWPASRGFSRRFGAPSSHLPP